MSVIISVIAITFAYFIYVNLDENVEKSIYLRCTLVDVT